MQLRWLIRSFYMLPLSLWICLWYDISWWLVCIRNLWLLRGICKDVRIEPELIPLGQTETESTNTSLKARLDVSAVGIWSSMERTFLDVRVMHPNSASYKDTKIDDLYIQHETEKKRTYNHRIMHVEKGSFSPLVFSTTGGMGPEATRYHKRIAELISTWWKSVVNYIVRSWISSGQNCVLLYWGVR